MDAEPGGILYLQEFFSDSVNEITFSFIDDDKSEFIGGENGGFCK